MPLRLNAAVVQLYPAGRADEHGRIVERPSLSLEQPNSRVDAALPCMGGERVGDRPRYLTTQGKIVRGGPVLILHYGLPLNTVIFWWLSFHQTDLFR